MESELAPKLSNYWFEPLSDIKVQGPLYYWKYMLNRQVYFVGCHIFHRIIKPRTFKCAHRVYLHGNIGAGAPPDSFQLVRIRKRTCLPTEILTADNQPVGVTSHSIYRILGCVGFTEGEFIKRSTQLSFLHLISQTAGQDHSYHLKPTFNQWW